MLDKIIIKPGLFHKKDVEYISSKNEFDLTQWLYNQLKEFHLEPVNDCCEIYEPTAINTDTRLTNPHVTSNVLYFDLLNVIDNTTTTNIVSIPLSALNINTTLIDNGDNTFTYTNENGIMTTINKTVPITNTLSSSVNTITSNVNSIISTAPIINSVVNTYNNDEFITTVNGVSSATINLSTILTADNGLTKTLNNVQLGGNLLKATTITNNSFNLNIVGSTFNTNFRDDGRVFINPNVWSILNCPLNVGVSTTGRSAILGNLQIGTTDLGIATGNAIAVAGSQRTFKISGSFENLIDDTVFEFISGTSVGVANTISTKTSGEVNMVVINSSTGSSGFVPTSGNASYNHLHIKPKINQTGTANGISRGIYINNINVSSATDYRALEINGGKTVITPLATTIYTNNAAAISAGEVPGTLYHNGDGIVRVVF